MQFIDETNNIYGRLTVLYKVENYSETFEWVCICECGNITSVNQGNLRRKDGGTKSCGCLKREQNKRITNKLHQDQRTHGRSKTQLYKVWDAIKQRCNNPKTRNYKNYGGRGIIICDQWLDFETFANDVGERPGKEYSLDRINNDGNYEPGNVRWATCKEQALNRRKMIQLPEEELLKVFQTGFLLGSTGKMEKV